MSQQMESPRAGRRDALAVLAKTVHALEEKVQQLMNEQGELSETVSVLESFTCSCRDCVMHRDKARHGKVRDQVKPCGVCWQWESACRFGGCYHDNVAEDEPAIPPEPAAPEADLPPMCSNPACPNYGSSCFEACPDWPKAEAHKLRYCYALRTTFDEMRDDLRSSDLYQYGDALLVWVNEGDLAMLHMQGAAQKYEAPACPKGAAPSPEIWSANIGPFPTAASVRDAGDSLDAIKAQFPLQSRGGGRIPYNADAIHVALGRAYAAGQAEPQPISIDWNTALDTFHATARAPNGTASDGLMAVLRLIPGLRVEG